MIEAESFIDDPTSKPLGIREVVVKVREALGTYSNYAFSQDLQALLDSEDPLDTSAKAAAEHYTTNKRDGISEEVIDWMITHRLKQAPEGFVSVEGLRNVAKSDFDLLHETIRQYARLKGAPDAVVDDLTTYNQHQEKLAPYFVHARSRGNGMRSLFFSPKAQRDIARMVEEKKRSADEPKKAPRQNLFQPERPVSQATNHEAAINKLRARLETILPQVENTDRILANGLLTQLTTALSPTDANYIAGQIKALEEEARRNRRDD